MGNTINKGERSKATDDPKNREEIEINCSTFTCEICIEPMSSSNMFNNNGKCVHPFCKDCISKYIRVRVEDYSSATVECPGLNCKEFLDPILCSALIEKEAFVKWCDNLCESAILGVDKCYCPYPTCSALVLNECGGKIRGSSKCPDCKKPFCFKCKTEWHAGYRCDESGVPRDRNDVLFGLLVETKKWARCPGCGHSIELIHGCSTVRCRCKTSFCYRCGAKGDHRLHICRRNQTDQVQCENLLPWGLFAILILFVIFSSYACYTDPT